MVSGLTYCLCRAAQSYEYQKVKPDTILHSLSQPTYALWSSSETKQA